MDSRNHRRQAGFTLVELLVVIGIIVILFSVILVAVDPARRLSQARDAVRRQDVRTILDAVLQFTVDGDGIGPAAIDGVTASFQVLGTDPSGCNTTCTAETSVAACVDLSGDLVDEYLADIPFDPLTGDAGNSDYAINQTANGRIEVASCDPEIAAAISVKR